MKEFFLRLFKRKETKQKKRGECAHEVRPSVLLGVELVGGYIGCGGCHYFKPPYFSCDWLTHENCMCPLVYNECGTTSIYKKKNYRK